jgi:hypothetical protein
LDQEKSKHVSLVQQNGFGPTFYFFVAGWQKSTAKPIPATDCLDRLIDPSGLLLAVSLALCIQSQF